MHKMVTVINWIKIEHPTPTQIDHTALESKTGVILQIQLADVVYFSSISQQEKMSCDIDYPDHIAQTTIKKTPLKMCIIKMRSTPTRPVRKLSEN